TSTEPGPRQSKKSTFAPLWGTLQDSHAMSESPLTLVCFAVKEEAGAFNELAGARPHLNVLLTGIGQRNAERTVRAALALQRPKLVLTCGFAGGLRPDLLAGTVLFAAAAVAGLEPAFLKA